MDCLKLNKNRSNQGCGHLTPDRGYDVTAETLESVTALWRSGAGSLAWDCMFVLPPWLAAWWHIFGTGLTPALWAVRHEGQVVGLAPFVIEGDQARFMGSSDVCDFLDCVVQAGKAREVLVTLMAHLKQQGIVSLDLGPVRQNSVVLTQLPAAAAELGWECSCREDDVTLELELPNTWDGFLDSLSGKERHELRRKFRRLREAAAVSVQVVEDQSAVREGMEAFLKIFTMNRPDKAAFMTERMASFFRCLAEAMTAQGFLRLFFLELDGEPAAGVMCFDYNSTVYLYNNGYNNSFRTLGVGLLSKVLTIRDSIDRGRKTYDFLKGSETYKRRLGGKPVQLHRCFVRLR
jgi:CelD/BcsL family acetyltransferase involved in cellulose biosynthesis